MDVRAVVRKHILETHFPSTQDQILRDDESLIAGGILDSISVLDLLLFIEEQFEIEFMPHEVDFDRLDTLERIDRLIRSKLGAEASGEK